MTTEDSASVASHARGGHVRPPRGGTHPHLGGARRGRGPSTPCGSATRSRRSRATSRSPCWPRWPRARGGCAWARPCSCPALRQPVVLAQIVATLDRIAEGRVILGVGHRGRRAGHPQGVRERGRPLRAAGRPLPGDPRDLPGPVAPRRRELPRQALHPRGRHHGPEAPSRRRAAHLDRGQRADRPPRGRALRRLVPHRAERGVLRRAVPRIQAAAARGGHAPPTR